MKCLSEFVLCFLSATEVFTTLTTNQEEEEDDPEVASAIVPEISVKKKINQVVVTRRSIPSKRLCACV